MGRCGGVFVGRCGGVFVGRCGGVFVGRCVGVSEMKVELGFSDESGIGF